MPLDLKTRREVKGNFDWSQKKVCPEWNFLVLVPVRVNQFERLGDWILLSTIEFPISSFLN